MSKLITIFGSSAPQPGEPAYEQARRIGQLLAEAGYGVATGGYIGTMAAVSQGAAEAGGRVVGVVSNQIERFRPIGPNRWINEEVRYETLRERLLHLIDHNDGMIALPGGIGTLSEVSLAWSFLQTGEISPRPFVLLGAQWHQTMHTFLDPAYVRDVHWRLLRFANTPDEAVTFLLNGAAS